MRFYAFETADGKVLGQPFAAENDDDAKKQVISIFAPAVLNGVTEYDDTVVVCLFSAEDRELLSSVISLHERVATIGEIFSAALLKYLAARPEVDFDKLEVQSHAENENV